MKRFCLSFSFAVVLFSCRLLSSTTSQQGLPPHQVNLDGEWVFSIHGRAQKPLAVPSTYLPNGGATLSRTFAAPKPAGGWRALLHLEGVSTTAEVWVNNHKLGEFGPFTPFSLDVTDSLKDGANDLRV